jgi:hypothetical protein
MNKIVKIFQGYNIQELEKEINNFQKPNGYIIKNIVQSQSLDYWGNTLITITLFFN